MEHPSTVSQLVDVLTSDRIIAPSITGHVLSPAEEARYGTIALRSEVRSALATRGIEQLYTHQVEAIEQLRRGENVVVMTPTASGKSLIYNIPVIESIIADPNARALFIFPLKGLEQDQVQTFNRLIDDCLGEPFNATKERRVMLRRAEVYDGDTTPYRRKKIRESIPNVIFTNPDMLHMALNPFHKLWGEFFRNLKYVVIDEVHTYRGVFGSHVAHVFRRLRRICRAGGAEPQFVALSATIANPKELAETLTGLPFSVVDGTGSPRAGKHFLFVNPSESPYTEATRLFLQCVSGGLRTILFTKARKVTELIYAWSVQRAPELAPKISPYRAGFLPSERREIEQRLFNGDLVGVISTSALELGIDVGELDVCILCGYPGSVSSTWQRAGRVGRKGRESLIVLIALRDALDQYMVNHQDMVLGKSHERVACDPWNRKILKQHLRCAAYELYLKHDDGVYDFGEVGDAVREIEQEGLLKAGRSGDAWFARGKAPHREVGIRSIGTPLAIRDEAGRLIGDLDGRRIYREAFPGAIYLHRGKQYEVTTLDLDRNEALCREVDVPYYTRALSEEHMDIIGPAEPWPESYRLQADFLSGELRSTYRVVGFEKRNIFDGTRVSRHTVEMPEYVFDTEGIWMAVPRALVDELVSRGFSLPGTLHGAEHVLISCIPLFSLCDKGDIGGVSFALYPSFDTSAIFMYDGYEGGIGLTKAVIRSAREWIRSGIEVIEQCPCDGGCPSCIQDPQCGSGNEPLDKQGALYFLKRLRG